ncbi:MAG: SPFH domain-containing protein [Planctomycetota bacterium]
MAAISRKRAETLAMGGIGLTLASAIVMFILAKVCDSLAANVEAYHLLAAAVIWLVTLLHLRARRNAEEERSGIEEAERLRAEEGRARLFETDELQSAIAQTRLRQMERYGAPLAGLVIIALQLVVGIPYLFALYFLQRGEEFNPSIQALYGAELSNASLGAFCAFGVAFLCFILGKYAAGMARDPRLLLSRAGAGYTLSCALASLLLAVSYALGYTGWLLGATILGWVFPSILVVIALEMSINFILDFYRPRLPGQFSRPIYDGRLTGLLAEPQGILRTFAHTLDYQFGFQVSETWFFRFLNKAIAPLILFQLAALYLLTCMIVVEPGDVAIIERWGRPRGVAALPPIADEAAWDRLEPPLAPGFHIKWPWPIEIAHRVPCQRVQQILVGAPQEELTEARMAERGKVVGWSDEHIKNEYRYIMPLATVLKEEPAETATAEGAERGPETPDAMYVSGTISVQYAVGRIDAATRAIRPGDPYRYLYRQQNPRAAMISISEREITSFMGGADFWSILVEKTNETEQVLTRRIQAAVDEAGLGIRVLFVSVSNLHPPAGEVGLSYQAVVAARQERETSILNAMTREARLRAETPGEAAALLNDADEYYVNRTLVSQAESQRFANQFKAYRAAPEVFLHREKMRAIEEGLKQAARVLLAPSEVTVVVDDTKNITAGAVGQAILRKSAEGSGP